MRDTLYPSPDYTQQTTMVTSRLAKNEQKKMVRQTLLLGLGAVALLLSFIFLIIPGMIRILDWLGGSSGNVLNSDTIPPQVPILSAPVSATNSAQLKIKGYGESGSKLLILLNGNEQNQIDIAEDGQFEAELQLSPGENVISTYSIDAAENESAESKSYSVKFDNEVPKLEIAEPQDGQQFELRRNQTMTIKGTTEANAKVFVNGRTVYAGNDGAFSSSYQLQEGENKLLFKAQDEAGNAIEQELTVNFKL